MTFHLRLSQRYTANRVVEPGLVPHRPPLTTATFRRRRAARAALRFALEALRALVVAVGTAGIVAALVALVYLAR